MAADGESPGHRQLLEEEIRLLTGVKNPGWLWNPLADLDTIKCPVCSQQLNHVYEAVEKGCPRCSYRSKMVSRNILKAMKGKRDF
jgi:phage FluMu protein Com